MAIDSRALRDALGRFTTGVCVATAVDAQHHAIGMTVNSFSALSLDPPLILWSIQKDSDRFAAFAAAGGFGISILSEEQGALSDRYAQRGDCSLEPGSYRLGRSGQAVLKNSISSFECRMWQQVDGGDHVILIGEVIELSNHPSGRPLLFYSGRYCQLRQV